MRTQYLHALLAPNPYTPTSMILTDHNQCPSSTNHAPKAPFPNPYHIPCPSSTNHAPKAPLPNPYHNPCPSKTNHAPRAAPQVNHNHNQCPSKTNHAPRAAPKNLPNPHPKFNHAGRKSAYQHPAQQPPIVGKFLGHEIPLQSH